MHDHSNDTERRADEIHTQDDAWQLDELDVQDLFQQLSGNLAGC